MEKKLYPITLLTVLLAGVAVAGYMLPQSSQEETLPIRIQLTNKGGTVMFEHAVHAEEYGLECATCHHAENLQEGVSRCGDCHNPATAEFNLPDRMAAFHQSCMGCHEEIGSGPYGKEHCNQCHLK